MIFKSATNRILLHTGICLLLIIPSIVSSQIPDWENAEITAINKLPARAWFIPSQTMQMPNL